VVPETLEERTGDASLTFLRHSFRAVSRSEASSATWPIEHEFGLDPRSEGVLAVCGFGWRAPTITTTELDPAGVIWNPEARVV